LEANLDQVEQLDASISTLMRLLTIDERRLSSDLGAAPFNALDLETLSYVQRHPGSGAKDAATFLGISATTMQSAVDRLHKRGLLQRDPSALKGRAVALTLTMHGTKLRQQLHAQNLKNCLAMLECLEESERDRFVQNMVKIATTF
jgi:DNA-binding MarR family transcriptional regulator